MNRFHILDILRALSAFAVVVYHWQHFGPARPFDAVLQPLYLYGDKAVEVFFVLSGFIFYTIYAERLASGEVSPRHFFVMRFSRLYPLHFVTLACVAALQVFHKAAFGGFFVYPKNDALHFVIQVLMLSGWNTSFVPSFNGPAWSVSIECFHYLVFLFLCANGLNGSGWAAAMCLTGLCLYVLGLHIFGRGLFWFFLGGLIANEAGDFVRRAELRMGRWARGLSRIGDITYSSYLWHFPLQIAFVLLGLNCSSRATFTCFMLLLVFVASLSYLYCELPAKNMLRGYFRSPNKK